MKVKFLFPILFFALSSSSLLAKVIPLDHLNISIEGAPYALRSANKLIFNRFPQHILALPEEIRMFPARTASSTSGVVISIKTGSPSISLTFEQQPGLAEKSVFKILRNGEDYQTLAFSETEILNGIDIKLDSFPDSKVATYDIVMPSYSNLALTRLLLDDKSELLKPDPARKKILITFGDSITHGRGQDGASFLTYPYILSRKLGMSLYNQAVGSAKVSVPLARESNNLPQADLITILIGYNDLNGAGKSSGQYDREYRDFLAAIRKNQPGAKIYCITLLYTKKKKNAKTGHTPEDFRNVVRKIYADLRQTDENLFLIEGEDVSSAANLKPGENTDGVHLTIEGARMLAEALFTKLK